MSHDSGYRTQKIWTPSGGYRIVRHIVGNGSVVEISYFDKNGIPHKGTVFVRLSIWGRVCFFVKRFFYWFFRKI